MSLRAVSVIKSLSSPLGDSSERPSVIPVSCWKASCWRCGLHWFKLVRSRGKKKYVKKAEEDLAIPVSAGADPSSSP